MAKEKKTENTSVPAEHMDAADRTVRSGIGSDDTAEPVAMSTFLKQNRLTKNEISTESVKSQADVLGALARCSIGGQRETHAENVLSSASTDKLSMSLVKDGATTNALNFPLFSDTGSISESSEEPWVQDLEEVPFGHDGHSVQKQVAVKEYDVEATFENNGRNNCMEVNAIDIVDDEISTSASRMKMSSSRVPVLRIERGDMRWLAHGYKEMSPLSNKVYFTSLEAMDRVVDRESISGFGLSGVASSKRVISVCIPCYNEDASALKRSLTSLAKQNLPADVTMEILVAMDGVVQLSDSMAAYLSELFGISFIVGHENNPFERLQTPNTVVVEPIFEDKNMFGANLALLIKRKNLRKVNSQEWWLRSHAPASLCEFAFATDCGITFDTNCLQLMLKRFDIDPNMSGLTGYQRVMSAKMQGDGRFEILTDPVGCFLRLLQSYDFEVSQSTTKSLLDSIGFIPVLPGPCSFFRTKHLQGVLDEYFSLTTETIKGGRGGIVLGNVQLAEDRFPPVLLTFRSKDSCKDAGLVRPKTGFEHDAVFYFEAEKPLRQLVTQRRRWINGAYTAVYWVLLDSWIRKADHSIFTKLGASLILFIEFAQGALVRTCVPATLACGLMYMCTIFPSVYANDAEKVRDILDGGTVEPSLVGIGAAAAFFYLSLFAVFIFSHTPRAIPVTDDNGEVHWRSDSSSAYRPRIFFLAFVVNAITIAVFVYVGVGVFMIVGWQGTPGYFQALCLLMALPYLVALMDGLINSERPNLRAVWNMLMLFPIFLISSVWFYVWLPCYASARISDLSWGNRDCSGQSCKSSDVAIYRAYLGRVVSISLVIINTLLTGSIIGVGNFVDGFLTIVLFSLLVLNMMLHLGNLLDMLVRLCFTRIPRWVCGEAPVYLKKQDNEVNKSAPASEISSHDDESGDGSIASESPTPIGPGRWRIDF